ncbi:MAG: hypothetical protein RIC55_06760 [Pirellulaceae bacterium]
MSQDTETGQPAEEAEGSSRIAIIVTVVSLALLGLCWALAANGVPYTRLGFLLMQVVVISIVIWQVCDPFADAAQWVGTVLRVPGSVRGATLDAVASSMPELFSGIFFVVVAITTATGTPAEIAESGQEGYGATLATCAGSAIYNMILIPAFCALVISFCRKSRPTIDVEREVISRDGMWFIGCEAVLIIFLFQDRMYWWMALVLLGMYCVYIFQLYRDARRYQRAMDAIHRHLGEVGEDTPTDEIVETLRAENIHTSPMLVDAIKHSADEDDDEEPETAGIFYGMIDIPLNKVTATLVLLVATLLAAGACYWLVEVTRGTATELGVVLGHKVPVFFVAVILAAAASSVPDTFLAIGAAMRGDDSGAVSNAFGSNIFDICICLSIPLLVNSYLLGWGPVPLTQEGGEPIAGLVDLRILLATLTVVTLLIMWHNRQLTRNKAFVLCGLYGLFMAYAVAGSMGFSLLSMLGLH